MFIGWGKYLKQAWGAVLASNWKRPPPTPLCSRVLAGSDGTTSCFASGLAILTAVVAYPPRFLETSYQASTGKYTMTSDLSFRNRFSFGFDALAGVNISHSFVIADFCRGLHDGQVNLLL
ncbi:MAG: hypothetical protein LBF84_01755 [Holosporales bacterium]|nr:hypothetical protein [Holosporales bacterium]